MNPKDNKICVVRKLGEQYYSQPCVVLKWNRGINARLKIRFRDGAEFFVPRSYLRSPTPEELAKYDT